MLAGELSYEDGLDALTVASDADAALHQAVAAAADRLFQAGWQPAELYRVVARLGDPVQAQVVAGAAGRYLAQFRDVDPRWQAQVEELPRNTVRADRIRLHDATLGLLLELRKLPRIDTLIPPPGTIAATRYRGRAIASWNGCGPFWPRPRAPISRPRRRRSRPRPRS
ncbi:hypothetical protein [Paractinoplanes durhamensis]|uniref:hypothetical protein n=1 Tax=Paractinoplanes durhamensis TaxID=113563 RepID=UPI00362C78C8